MYVSRVPFRYSTMTQTRFSKPMVIPAGSKPEKEMKPGPVEAVKARRSYRESTALHTSNKQKTHVPWLDDEISSTLAWICKNKDAWGANKSVCLDHISKKIFKNRRTPQAIYVKLRHIQLEYNKCFQFVRYKGQDEPVRKSIPGKVEKARFFKECRAAFGPPVYEEGARVQEIDAYPRPPKPKELTPSIATPTQNQFSRETLPPSASTSPSQTKRAYSESMEDTPLPLPSPSPTRKIRRLGVVADDNGESPSPQLDGAAHSRDTTESEDMAMPDSPRPTPTADGMHATKEDRAHELELKRQELELLIQGTEVKMERTEARFERLRERHAYHQERRRQRLLKYKEELNRLIAND
ncbi:hypothetical protein BJV82DRAFT_712904 [Fennellomyces sp. T-0311]|nr:hypothetical protein BJV82DRAFT_712904 [Fennellomyces sp. T-0311]